LTYPNQDLPYRLHTDASSNSIGAVLNQINETNGSEQPVGYFSRKLKDTEINYSISEREALALYEGVKFFQPYLWLQKFTIITDHSALKFMFKSKNTVPKIARWALYLSDFNYEIEYKSGKTHVVPDYLSRNDCDEFSIAAITEDDERYTIDTDELIKEQRSDPMTSRIISHLEGNTPFIPKIKPNCSIDEFYLDDNILYRLPRISSKISKVSAQVVIPRTLVNLALRISHDNPITVHQGYLRTLERTRDNFYWPNMARDIKSYVQQCLDCQKRKWQGKITAPLGEFPPVSYPLERVGVDLIELSTTHSNNKYILTVIDHFSKYVSAYPLPNKSAETVTRAMVQFISNNSVPKEIVSDRGSEFISELFTKTCKLLEAKNKFTTAYHPMANGLTEKANSTIKKTLSHLAKDDRFTWDDQLPTAVLAINTSFQTSIQEIPFFLFHGRDARLPFNQLINKEAPINYAEEDYSIEMSLRLHKAFSHVQNMSKISREKAAVQYDKKATKNDKLHIGSMVLLRNETNTPENANAWPTRYIGPYRILNRNKNAITIKGIYHDTAEQVVHINRVKLAHLKPNLPFPFNNNLQENRSHEPVPSQPPIESQTEILPADIPTPINPIDTITPTINVPPNTAVDGPRYNLRKRRT
jgi:transposase InsO family protein